MMIIKTEIKNVSFESNAPFRSCVSKINNTFIDNVEDLDIIMPMYNMLEDSHNYFMSARRLWNYHRDEMNDDTKWKW